MPARDPYRLTERLGHRLTRTSSLMQRFFDERAPVSRMVWTVLASVGIERINAPSAIAAHTGMTRPAVSRLLARMEADGLLVRGAVAGDGRAAEVRLTGKGRAVMAETRKTAEAVHDHFTAKLTPGELAELHRLLARLAEGETGGVSRF